MSDELWRRKEIESPCVQICLIHPEAGICLGCHRTREEIATWSRMADKDRREIMEMLPERKSMLPGRRGGRKGRRKG